AQTFSKSVANAMIFCKETLNNPNFLQSAATSQFCIYINNIFDLLNSRNLFSKISTKQYITRKNIDNIKTQVQDFITYLSSLNDQTGPILNSSRKIGFLGMIIALRSTIEIAETLFIKDENFSFLMTYKISQDHIETFFSAIRSRGGFNNNPTAWEFKTVFKHLLVKTDIRILYNTNCQLLD
ncbi:THAP domain-containing protein 9, partial [Harpegnathos saltator]